MGNHPPLLARLAGSGPIRIATRGSALALTQARWVQALCRRAMPDRPIELSIIKTVGDQMQSASLAEGNLPKGLFTKDLELALLQGAADLAVHSLKDLPTTLPDGLKLGAVGEREDARDVLIYRDRNSKVGSGFDPGLNLSGLPPSAALATSSTRRAAQALELCPSLRIHPIRGNVGTRLRKLSEDPGFDATLLAAAGLNRLGIRVREHGMLTAEVVVSEAGEHKELLPVGLRATLLPFEQMLPCVGQGAIGIEIRAGDALAEVVCEALNHRATEVCVTAERSFLHAMGGGCQAAVAALARLQGDEITLHAVSYLGGGPSRRAEASAPVEQAADLGVLVAQALRTG